MRIRIAPELIYFVCVFGSRVLSFKDQCFCQLKGKVEECCCDIETVDKINKDIYPIINEIVQRNYFKFFRVKLDRPCPFWASDGQCTMKHCSVSPCKEDDIPEGVKSESKRHQSRSSKSFSKYSKSRNSHTKLKGEKENERCSEPDNTTLGNIDNTISYQDKLALESWDEHDEDEEEFCQLDDESTEGMAYVDLLRNPERYTGYKGPSAHRIWNSIYQENCFKPEKPKGKGYRKLMTKNFDSMCLEKRVFYRAISGLHASINIHLSALYLFPGVGLQKPQWGMNLEEFTKRFSSELTDDRGPVWLKNLYFTYTMVLRAVTKAASFWESEQFYTGDYEEDEYVHELVQKLIAHSRTCPSTFDEKVMFKNPATAKILKEEFRQHFLNVSRIMDCVGCEKCRLWGKLQTQGLGTALKILFSGHEFEGDNVLKSQSFNLKRTEIVSLFNGFARLSSSINYLTKFKNMDHGHQSQTEKSSVGGA
ncbi:ERO1-like protein beta [Actinia tenebrosa]|uniref:ERO1-like protein beta n=1 Tax=Actinia tenebrosa TaxID=6105 RepID=A0A6P8I111_ACTTE|nr:ERO1-like protein beta [Actinia tenebrosa]